MDTSHPLSPLAPDWNETCKLEILAAAHEDWLGLPVRLERLPDRDEITDIVNTESTLVMARTGHGKRWYTTGLFTREFGTAPGMIDIYDAGYHIDRGRWDGSQGELIAIRLPANVLERLQGGDGRPPHFSTRHELFDQSLSELIHLLWREASNGAPRGRLFTEGLTLSLVGLLLSHEGGQRSTATHSVGKLGAKAQSRLLAFVDTELGTDLCIERLATVVGISPDHFARMFKSTFGQTPHAFVQDRRIEAARRALKQEPDRSVADIANGCGFSSQSHFTEIFRRKVGTTPRRWRQ